MRIHDGAPVRDMLHTTYLFLKPLGLDIVMVRNNNLLRQLVIVSTQGFPIISTKLSTARFHVGGSHQSAPLGDMAHEYEVRADSTSKQANIRLKNFVSVSLSSHRPRVKEMKVCAAVHHDACPHTITPLDGK
ncbi:hypothetical protein TNCV_4414041 [Trichonephila clavipes]|uniref:Uncharacterized protein n=1 Tax=Trichonephila clavipes TaxID=2585209 RepID=A0A8X6S0U4_TRICX|nr:hypothetical protein TNCV_4414041 [Trichonephila clavipes]